MLRRREAAGVSLTGCLCALEFCLELLLLLVSNRLGFFIRPLKKKGWFDRARGQTMVGLAILGKANMTTHIKHQHCCQHVLKQIHIGACCREHC